MIAYVTYNRPSNFPHTFRDISVHDNVFSGIPVRRSSPSNTRLYVSMKRISGIEFWEESKDPEITVVTAKKEAPPVEKEVWVVHYSDDYTYQEYERVFEDYSDAQTFVSEWAGYPRYSSFVITHE